MVLDIDLNCTPVEETSVCILPQVFTTELNKGQYDSPIDVDALDDDIELLSSPPLFSQVRRQSQKNHRITMDLEADPERLPVETGTAIAESAAILLSFNGRCDLELVDEQPCTNLTLFSAGYGRIEENNFVSSSSSSMSALPPSLPSVPPPSPSRTDSSMNCPICLDTFSNPCSTACGHIFCEKCIDASIKASVKQKKGRICPNCRSKLPSRKSYHRVYLPNMN